MLLQSEATDSSDSVAQQRDALKLSLERDSSKTQLFRACAACNRGFGASDLDRQNVNFLLEELIRMNPCDDATTGVKGTNAAERWVGRGLELSDWSDGTVANGPLEGVWRLIYTNASDVLALDSNPIAGVGPISQEITLPGDVVNIIELYPRAASLLPPGVLRTSTTLRVNTRARARSTTRVGLTFERVDIVARDLLGIDITKLLPTLSIPLPRVPGSDAAGADSESSPAYLDVTYLDNELLIVTQNRPGGVFALVRETKDELRLRDAN
jgi:hypothetical protein